MKPMLWRHAEFPGSTVDDAKAELARLYVEMDDRRAELAHLALPGVNNGEVRDEDSDVMDNVIRGYEACLRRLYPELRNFAFDEAWARGLVGAQPDGAGS